MFCTVLMHAQDTIGNKLIKKGIWKGKAIDYVSGQVAVFLKPEITQANFTPLIGSFPATVVRDFDNLGVGVLEAPDSVDIFPIIDALEQSPLLRAVEPIGITHTHYPNDPHYLSGKQWGLSRIDVQAAWNITKGDPSIKIAILDSGIPLDEIFHFRSHADLDASAKIIIGRDFIDPCTPQSCDTTVRDVNGHGTHVAGIAGAETDNNEGIAGVAPNCKLLIVKVFNSHGFGTPESFYRGVLYAVGNGAKHTVYAEPSLLQHDVLLAGKCNE